MYTSSSAKTNHSDSLKHALLSIWNWIKGKRFAQPNQEAGPHETLSLVWKCHQPSRLVHEARDTDRHLWRVHLLQAHLLVFWVQPLLSKMVRRVFQLLMQVSWGVVGRGTRTLERYESIFDIYQIPQRRICSCALCIVHIWIHLPVSFQSSWQWTTGVTYACAAR